VTIQLTISSEDLAHEDLHNISLDLVRIINSETDALAELPESNGATGAKGDAVTIGQVILTALTSGAVVALFRIFKAYIERRPSLTIEIKNSEGKTLKITETQLRKGQVDHIIELVDKFIKDQDD
jgi:hypothetical protein